MPVYLTVILSFVDGTFIFYNFSICTKVNRVTMDSSIRQLSIHDRCCSIFSTYSLSTQFYFEADLRHHTIPFVNISVYRSKTHT